MSFSSSETVKRFKVHTAPFHTVTIEMEADIRGAWVTWDDHYKLLQAYQILENRISEATQSLQGPR